MIISAASNPLVSVIIPVKNGSRTLDACLRSIKRSYYNNTEIIVVDDHSTDNSVKIAERYGCKVLQSVEGDGANRARNFGVQNAIGKILIFIDSDIVVKRDTILTVVETLEEGGIDAVVGIYTTQHRHETLVSQYKNLWIRYSYLKSSPAIDWLFGAISGIKRDIFYKIGGFNIALAARHGNDDIELGKRFSQAKLNIALNMDIEVEHLKNYTLWSFIQNEFHRSSGFAKLATQLGETISSWRSGFANVYPVFILSTAFSVLLLAAVILIIFDLIPPSIGLGMAGLYLLLNIRFLNYLEQVRGLFAMIAMTPIIFLDHLVCFVGSIIGIIQGLRSKP